MILLAFSHLGDIGTCVGWAQNQSTREGVCQRQMRIRNLDASHVYCLISRLGRQIPRLDTVWT